MIQRPDQRVGIFIDTQNMYYSARNVFGQKVSFGNIVKDAVGDRRLIRATAYVVSTKTGDEAPFFEALRELGIETKEKVLMEYLSGLKKADWDVGITVDAIRMLDMLDVVVLVSGDGDFVPLINFIQSRGRIAEVMSFRETTSTRLVESVDRFTNLSDDKDRYLLSDAKSRGKRKPPVTAKKSADIGTNEDFTDDDSKDEGEMSETRSRRLSF